MDTFIYAVNPTRVVFGNGSIQKLPDEVARLKVSRPLLISGPRHAEHAESLGKILNGQFAGIFSEATMHGPVEVTNKAVEYVASIKADSFVSIGGGSAVGLGKALSIRTGFPHIAIPTTYSGSEMTSQLGETADGVKTTRIDPKIQPATVIYDADLTLSLPPNMSATSGVNAIAHAVEALYAQDTNPIVKLLAAEGIRELASSLPQIVESPTDRAARTSALRGAWLCGTCLSSTKTALHHKLCHALGGSLNLPHSETHTIVLPHALAYNIPALSADIIAQIADALPESQGDPLRGLNILLTKLKVKKGLKEYGMKESDIDKVTDIALKNPYWNPRAIEKAPIRELIRRAWAGEEARGDL